MKERCFQDSLCINEGKKSTPNRQMATIGEDMDKETEMALQLREETCVSDEK